VGFLGFVILVPLAMTSTAKMIKRLGGKRWQLLHRLVYTSAVAGVVHYLWLVKADVQLPLIYGSILAVLLGYRLWGICARHIRPGKFFGRQPIIRA
jgi:sulfoxide reductase heme-binding subunit YedZ